MWWWIAGGLIAIWMLYCVWKAYDNQGRHNQDWDGWLIPHGSVWMQDGVWFTQPRRDFPKPRRFAERSNPLDHEYRYERREVPPRFVEVPFEVEY